MKKRSKVRPKAKPKPKAKSKPKADPRVGLASACHQASMEAGPASWQEWANGQQQRRRPQLRSPELDDALVLWIAGGGTLSAFCRLEGTPNRATITLWERDDPVLAQRLARARQEGFAEIAEDTLRIADTPVSGRTESVETGPDGVKHKTVHEDAIAHRKLQIETRLKLLACWDPRRYGQKLAVGGDADGVPIQMSDVERAARIQKLLAAAEARRARANHEEATDGLGQQ